MFDDEDKLTTLNDVAALAGVSVSTASYALSGTRKVSEATRQKVQRAMDELGYAPNESARSLASKKSRTIAMVMPSEFNPLDGTLAAILDAATRAAIKRNYRIHLWTAPLASDVNPNSLALPTAISGGADGAVLMEVLLNDPRITAFSRVGVPTVLIGRADGNHNFHSVDIDFERGIRDGVQKLRDLGHRAIGMINHSRMSFEVGYGPTRRSYEAFVDVVGEEALDYHAFSGEKPDSGFSAARDLVSLHPEITAFLVMNERAAFGAQRFVNQSLDSQRRTSILTVASSPGVSELGNPSFASFDAPAQQLGETAVSLLIDQLEGVAAWRTHKPELVRCEFVEGDSLTSV